MHYTFMIALLIFGLVVGVGGMLLAKREAAACRSRMENRGNMRDSANETEGRPELTGEAARGANKALAFAAAGLRRLASNGLPEHEARRIRMAAEAIDGWACRYSVEAGALATGHDQELEFRREKK
jgi:hypothetical protein